MEEEFPTRISCDVTAKWVSVTDIYEGAQHCNDRSTKFNQGSLGDCWLAAAIESLRHKNNKNAFDKVVQGELTYKFWQEGDYNREITLENNAVPVNDEGKPEFMRCIDGTEYWGILLEKAYAKWVGSYEGLAGGFWSDAMQSFTGGVIERIKLQDKAPENLFNIMLQSYQNGSSLCCIIKKQDINEKEMERYHTCCCIKIEESASKVMIRDPYVISDCHELTFDEFVKEYHRLDICHNNLDNFKEFQNKNIAACKWQEKIIHLHEGENVLDIELTEPDDGDKCSFLIEVVQILKPDGTLGLWQTVKEFELNCDDDMAEFIKFPQQAFPFIKPPGKYSVTFRDTPPNVFVRMFCKKEYPLQLRE